MEATIVDGHVEFSVTRVFANLGERPDEASLNLELPFSAAANGLKIKAREKWYDAELLRASEARQKYNELTGIGRHKLKDPAILEWQWNDTLLLQVFPVIHGKTSTVNYSLVAPTEYVDGRYIVSYPRHNGDPLLAVPTLSVKTNQDVWLDKVPISANQNVALSKDSRESKCRELSFDGHCVPIEVPVTRDEELSSATLRLDFSHSYLSDLSVFLVSPDGKRHDVTVETEADWKKDIKVGLEKTSTLGLWHVVFSDDVALDRGSVRAVTLLDKKNVIGRGEKLPMLIPDYPGDGVVASAAVIEIKSGSANRNRVRYGRTGVPTSGDFLTRIELDVAEKLSKKPKNPRYIFLLDTSRSMSTTGVEAQLDVMRSMLRHVPDATFEIVQFSRFARRVFGEFRTADALTSLPTFRPSNGSAIDAALELTHGIVTTERSKAPTFVIAMSDLRLRHRFDEEKVTKQFGANAIAHVVYVPRDEGAYISINRDDEMTLSGLAEKTGGISVRTYGFPISGQKQKFEDANAQSEHLIRPIKIEHFALSGVDHDVPIEMIEGSAIREVLRFENASKKITFSGKLWSKTVRWSATTKRSSEKLAAAWYIVQGNWSALTDEQQFKLGMFANVVTPQTSFLAVEPGVRPSTLGLPSRWLGGRGSRAASIRSGSMVATRKIDWKRFLSGVVRSCVKQHSPPAHTSVLMSIDVTGDEIVDVNGPKGAYETCLAEGIWKVHLRDESQRDREYEVEIRTDWADMSR